jgi:hypothetical protein
MKNLLLLTLAFCVQFTVIAQKKINQGLIVLELTDIDADDAEMAGMLSMMKGGTMETSFSPDMQKTVTNMMGGMVTTQTFVNMKTKEARTFMDMMGNKVMIKTDANDAASSSLDSDLDIVETKETKDIKGYKAKKYIIKPKGEADAEFILYVAESIDMGAISLGNNMNTTKIKGAPLEMSMKVQGMTMKYTAKSISDTLPKDAFKEPKGYKEMSMEEFQKSMGNMGF